MAAIWEKPSTRMPAGSVDFSVSGHRLTRARQWLEFQLVSTPFNPWAFQALQPDAFAGKRAIIVGPASTVEEDLRGVDVDAHDVVVRLNNGIALAKSAKDSHLGTRTDILFHNLMETGERSAGEITPELLQSHGVKVCTYPHWTYTSSKRRLRAKRRQLRSAPEIEFKVLPAAFCSMVQTELGGVPPTVGASAILFFLACDLQELAIHGFTFFETPYLAGYNDAVQTADDARAWVAKSPVHHDPGREKRIIRSRIGEAEQRGVRVSLGRNVRERLRG